MKKDKKQTMKELREEIRRDVAKQYKERISELESDKQNLIKVICALEKDNKELHSNLMKIRDRANSLTGLSDNVFSALQVAAQALSILNAENLTNLGEKDGESTSTV